MQIGLGQEITIPFHVTKTTDGSNYTGLTNVSFTKALSRWNGTTIVTDPATVTVSEIDAGLRPGDYRAIVIPNTGTGPMQLVLTGPSDAALSHGGEFDFEVVGGATLSTGPFLTTRANVKTAIKEPSAGDDARIDMLLAAVTTWAQNYCRRNFFAQTSITEYPDFDEWAETVNLEEFPVSVVTSVHVSTDRPRLYDSSTLLVAGEDYSVDLRAGIVHRIDGILFPAAHEAVRVIYDGGFATIPADLEHAAVLSIVSKLEKLRGQSYHLTNEQRGDGSAGYPDMLAPMGSDDIPLAALRVFTRYRRVA